MSKLRKGQRQCLCMEDAIENIKDDLFNTFRENLPMTCTLERFNELIAETINLVENVWEEWEGEDENND